MPCMSYDDRPDYTSREWKNKTDKLARIACKAMEELVSQGKADFLILRDDEVREWWEQHQEADRKAKEAELEKRRRAKVRREALAKLSDEERKILGVKK